MTRIDLALAILAVLLIAMVCGWALHWLWGQLFRNGPDPMHEMAEHLHEAEIARDEAEKRLAEVKAATASEIAEREAELEGAMDTVGALRRQISEWQTAYDALQSTKSDEKPE